MSALPSSLPFVTRTGLDALVVGSLQIETGSTGVFSEVAGHTEPSAFESLGFNLSTTTRLYGFGASTFVGFALSLLGSILFLLGQPVSFARA
jgi:hypothetical protein